MDISKSKNQRVSEAKPVGRRPAFLRAFKSLVTKFFGRVPYSFKTSVVAVLTVAILIAGLAVLIPLINPRPYDLSAASRQIIPQPSISLGKSLLHDAKKQTFEYNSGYDGKRNPESAIEATGSPRINASFAIDGAKGIAVTDPANKVDLRLIPKFELFTGAKSDNQVVYKMAKSPGHLVYTAQISGVKEDIVLERFTKNKLVYEYEIGIKNGFEARLEKNGSVGVYGADLPVNGEVSTGSPKDAELLEKVRRNAPKNTLLFSIPAPVVVETGRTVSVVKTRFELKGKKLKLISENLKAAQYPLTIDPSIYVETAQRLMRGNNETNLDFDVSNELIQKGKLTGARFDAWTSSLALPAARYNHGTTVYGGYIYVAGGNNGSATQQTVYWAKLNTTTGAIEAPNPGAGACASWCTETVFNLPLAREGLSLVAYNGYLYALGGTTGGTHSSSVYIAKLGLNGEPSLWHPTNTDKSTWTYWYTDANLSTARAYSGAVAYNNKMFLVGGQTAAGTTSVTTVESTSINPNGTFGTWSATGMIALPSSRYGHSVQVYNDRIYAIGGTNGTTTQSTVYYMKLNTDGTMAGTAWATTTPLVNSTGTVTGRTSLGGNFSSIWGGYMYATGGCTALNASGYCTATAGETLVSSINADGTVSDWQAIGGVTSTRQSFGFVSWRGVLYGVGGCTLQDTTTGACTTVSSSTNYGTINQDGDASTVNSSEAEDVGNCAAANNYKYCDLPLAGSIDKRGGRLAGGAVINNGFIYYIGGCTEVSNGNICFNGNASRVTDNISYAQITPNGTIQRVPTSECTLLTSTANGDYQYYGSWCVQNPKTSNGINAGAGIAAFGSTVFNNTIYIVGGTSGIEWQSKVWRNTPRPGGGITADWNGTSAQLFADIGITSVIPAHATGTPARGYSYVFTRANPAAAATNPGNLYVLGGCTGPTSSLDNGLNCDGALFPDVYKCNIAAAGSLNGCTTTGQLTIDAEPGTAGVQGLGVMAGAMYANYIYLVGGQTINGSERGEIIYAKIDNNNNIVDADGETVIDNIWTVSPNVINPVRKRGVAFGYNGYLYALAGYAGGASLNDLLFAKINTSDGSIGTFKTSNVTVDARWDLRAVVNNGYVYTMAGCKTGAPPASCTVMTGGVQIFQLYNNYSGSPVKYEYQDGTASYPGGTSSPYAGDKLGHGSTVVNGYLYVAGGCSGTGDCTVTTDQVSYAKINAFGYLGAWTNSGALDGWKLPASRGWGQLEAVGGTLYYIGGQSTLAALSTIYWTTPNTSTGAITTWNTTTKGIGERAAAPAQGAQARTKFGATVWNNRIYVVGGLSGMADTTAQNTVYISPSLSSGGDITGDWSTNSTGTAFNIARSGGTAIVYANNLYVLGGSSAASVILSDVQFGKITEGSTPSVSGWTYTSNLPDKLFGADGFAYNGFMYLFGGKASADICETNTIAAPISANTTVASGNNPTGIGEWFETNEKYIGSRYGASAAYYDGKAYISGGACNSTLTYVATANKMTQTSLLAQPQVAKYSRMIDTDTDVFPNSWLMNGLDNDIGARWRASYQSMHDLDSLVNPNEDCGNSATMPQMTTWGQITDVGEVTLGKINSYIPKNSTGANINCARFFYFYITIDSSQAYGYPEDVTRGPTISDISLFFTADPSKRLKHGKTFTGGEQQPLDTPCRDVNPAVNPDSEPNDDNCPAA